jgi:hypothetical protein
MKTTSQRWALAQGELIWDRLLCLKTKSRRKTPWKRHLSTNLLILSLCLIFWLTVWRFMHMTNVERKLMSEIVCIMLAQRLVSAEWHLISLLDPSFEFEWRMWLVARTPPGKFNSCWRERQMCQKVSNTHHASPSHSLRRAGLSMSGNPFCKVIEANFPLWLTC